MDPPSEDELSTGRKEKTCDVRHQGIPPPPASWPAANRASRNPRTTSQSGVSNSLNRSTSTSPAALPIATLPCTGFDEDLEVLLPGRGSSFFVRVAGRELAASNGVTVLIHGGGFTGMSWAPAAGLMKRDCCVLAPDLRGHGLTTSTPPPVGDRDSDLDGPDDDGHNDLMSLDSLAEDVTSLLVEIFSSGLLLRKQPRPREQKPSPEAEDRETEGTAAACSARGSEATLHRGAAEVAEASASAAAAAVTVAGSNVEARVSQEDLVAEEGADTAAGGSGDASHATREAALHSGAEAAAAAAAAGAAAEAKAEAKEAAKSAEAAGSKVGVHQPQELVAKDGDDEVAAGSGAASRATRARDSGEGGGATRLVESPGSAPKEGVDDSRDGVGVGGGGGSSCESDGGSKSGEGGGVMRLVGCPSTAAKGGTDGGGSGDNCDGGTGRGVPAGAGGGVAGEADPVAPGSASGKEQAAGDGCLRLLLVGHSLGGSIAVRMAGAAGEFKRRCGGAAEIAGVVAVDVVEGTALAALDDMPEILRKIPKSFPSMEAAVLWHSKTGAVRNAASASIVVPSRLKPEATGRVVWRTDLRATERHWRGWFEGMSTAFLALPIPKLLVVAGMDRLDTDLTAAHMMGKFQLKLVYGCGHSVQEDQPRETASSIMNFAVRNSVFRLGKGGAAQGARNGEEEELRRKLARARGQTSHVATKR